MFNSFLTPVALQLIVPFQSIYYNKNLFCDSQFEWIQSIEIFLLQLEKNERYLVGASTFSATLFFELQVHAVVCLFVLGVINLTINIQI